MPKRIRQGTFHTFQTFHTGGQTSSPCLTDAPLCLTSLLCQGEFHGSKTVDWKHIVGNRPKRDSSNYKWPLSLRKNLLPDPGIYQVAKILGFPALLLVNKATIWCRNFSTSGHLMTRSFCIPQQEAQNEGKQNCGSVSGSERAGGTDGVQHKVAPGEPSPTQVVWVSGDRFGVEHPWVRVQARLLIRILWASFYRFQRDRNSWEGNRLRSCGK